MFQTVSVFLLFALMTGCASSPPAYQGTSFAEFVAMQPGSAVRECGGYCGRMAKQHDYKMLGKRKPGFSLLHDLDVDFKSWCRAQGGEAVSYVPSVEILELYRRVYDTRKPGDGLACYSNDEFGGRSYASAYNSNARKLLGAMVSYTNFVVFLDDVDRKKLADILADRDVHESAIKQERDVKHSQQFACENRLNLGFRKSPRVGMKVSTDRTGDYFGTMIIDVREPLVQVQSPAGQIFWVGTDDLRFYDAYVSCR